MATISDDHRNTDGKSPTSVWLLRNPIDFIAEDHLRLRMMCVELDRLADTERAAPEAIAVMHEYLHQELPLLLADEDEHLVPRVLERAEPDDELPKLVRRLRREHASIERNLSSVVAGLNRLTAPNEMPSALRDTMRDLAHATRRHLILENAVLLPLARARLTASDLRALRRSMLDRRGLGDLFAE